MKKKIALYDIHTGKLVYIADSIKEAAEYCGVTTTLVSNAIHRRNYTHHIKRKWKPVECKKMPPDEITPPGDRVYNREKLPVRQLTLDGEYIRSFESLKEAANSISGAYPTAIWACLAGEQKTAYGYKWEREEDTLEEEVRWNLKQKGVL